MSKRKADDAGPSTERLMQLFHEARSSVAARSSAKAQAKGAARAQHDADKAAAGVNGVFSPGAANARAAEVAMAAARAAGQFREQALHAVWEAGATHGCVLWAAGGSQSVGTCK